MKKTITMMEYCESVRPKSFLRPPVFALLPIWSIDTLAYLNMIRVSSPNIGAVKIAEKVESPAARQDTPVQLPQQLLLSKCAFLPLCMKLLRFRKVIFFVPDMGFSRDCRSDLVELVGKALGRFVSINDIVRSHCE